MSSSLSSFFLFKPIDFPSKMMSCKLNHNLICLCIGPAPKCFETNFTLLTNRMLDFIGPCSLGPLFKVALSIIALISWPFLLIGPNCDILVNISHILILCYHLSKGINTNIKFDKSMPHWQLCILFFNIKIF
jgi:hypothetical protein